MDSKHIAATNMLKVFVAEPISYKKIKKLNKLTRENYPRKLVKCYLNSELVGEISLTQNGSGDDVECRFYEDDGLMYFLSAVLVSSTAYNK
ncbi:hypothetical protein ABEB36_003983 [Hypothenemus hampei]|uniref:Uncharacterized protein n=1 Tax=Hypothenemus hampei TaxID=57062 RepID=A0ABD1F1T6_HYPHA